jgi:hypothetical protein
MKIVSRSSLNDYAVSFLENEKRKLPVERRKEIEDVQRSGSAVSWVTNKCSYKLPAQPFSELFVARIESLDELERIRIYDRMLSDKWMQDRQLSPDSSEPYIGALADYFLAVGYFGIQRSDAQYIRYHEWKPRGHLTGAISRSAMPLIQGHLGSEFTVVDGWGRLLPYAALSKEGFQFAEFECFVATDTKSTAT